MKLKSLTDTFLITNTPSIEGEEFDRVLDHQYTINEAGEFDRHVLDHQYSLHWRTEEFDSFLITNTPSNKLAEAQFLITNTPSINEAEEFDRHVLDNQYSVHWRSWRVWETPSWSPILPPLKKLKNLTDTFLITNTASIEEAEEFDRHVLDHQYSLHWRSWRVWQTRSWSQYYLHWRSWRIWQTRSW